MVILLFKKSGISLFLHSRDVGLSAQMNNSQGAPICTCPYKMPHMNIYSCVHSFLWAPILLGEPIPVSNHSCEHTLLFPHTPQSTHSCEHTLLFSHTPQSTHSSKHSHYEHPLLLAPGNDFCFELLLRNLSLIILGW